MTSFIRIGQIINTHGHKGELKIYPLTDDVSRFDELNHIYIKQGNDYCQYDVDSVRYYQNFVLIFLKQIPDMNEAEKLKGHYLELPVNELRELPAGHFYIFQLIGLNVYENGRCLGSIKDVLKTGSNDVYVVKDPERKKEILIPALKEVVKSINLESGRVEVILPAGLED